MCGIDDDGVVWMHAPGVRCASEDIAVPESLHIDNMGFHAKVVPLPWWRRLWWWFFGRPLGFWPEFIIVKRGDSKTTHIRGRQ